MAHFPKINSRLRAHRVRVPRGEPVNFYLDDRCVSAVVHKLSLTGGLAESMRHVAPGTLAELKLETASGQVSGLVEFLRSQKQGATSLRAFRFLALSDDDHLRLSTTLQFMRNQGMGR